MIGLCHCAKPILIEFLSPRIYVDHFQIIGMIMSWTVFFVRYDAILMIMNQIGCMLHLFWIYQH